MSKTIADFNRHHRMRQFIRQLSGEYKLSQTMRRILELRAIKHLTRGCNMPYVTALMLTTARRIHQAQGVA